MALSCFSVCTLHHIQASNKHSVVCHLWHPNLLVWHAFWRIVSPMTYTLSHMSDPRFVRNWESNNPTSPVQCSFVKIWFSWLGMNENLQWQWLPWGIPPARRVFLGKVLGIREQLAASHVNSQSLVNPRLILLEKTQGKWTQGMRQDYCEAHFLWKKTRNVGAIDRITCKFTITLNARRAFIEKTHGIWKGFRDARFSWKKIRNPGAVGRVSYEFTITLFAKRILPEKTQGIWGGLVPRHFQWKTQGIGGVGHPWHINLQSKWSLGAIYTVYTTISPRSLADWGGGVY